MAKITLLGLNSYAASHDSDLFGLLTLPDGIDKDILTDNILLKGADFEALYPDVDFCREAIGLWGKKWNRTLTRWVTALSVDYDPLNNYDRTETETVTTEGSNSSNGTSSDSTNVTGITGTNEKVSAFDSSTMQPNTSTDATNSSNSSGNSSTVSNESHKEGTTRSVRAYGNIGVTTSQQMLEAELNVAEWNLYEHITDLFLSEFVIPIY